MQDIKPTAANKTAGVQTADFADLGVTENYIREVRPLGWGVCHGQDKKFAIRWLRHKVKVHFDNGDHLFTRINGTAPEVKEYYRVGRQFNIGAGEHDKLAKVSLVEFL